MALNKTNLRKLAKYLTGKRKTKFDMSMFSMNNKDPDGDVGIGVSHCGTIGCAVGHAPHAGIKKIKEESWFKYSERVFGIKQSSANWNFMFGGAWSDVDNTPRGAARRIKYILKNGKPPYNYREQMRGNVDLSYKEIKL